MAAEEESKGEPMDARHPRRDAESIKPDFASLRPFFQKKSKKEGAPDGYFFRPGQSIHMLILKDYISGVKCMSMASMKFMLQPSSAQTKVSMLV